MSDELIPENPEKQKEQLNEKAARLRELRDRLNDETKRHAARRDELNAKVRGLIDEANRHKAERDQLNREVREAKARRDELNKAANEKAEALNALKRERGPGEGVPLGKLKAELKRLEFEQMTKVLEPKKEKALIERIAELQKEVAEKEKEVGADDALRVAYDEMKAAKAAAEEQHRAVTVLANRAQAAHDAMVRNFGEADGFRKEADAAQAEFVKSKTEADRVHHEYIGVVTEIRGADRAAGEQRQRERRHPREGQPQPAVSAETKAEAEEIFGKFKRGEKLSMEDLMTLQRAGLL